MKSRLWLLLLCSYQLSVAETLFGPGSVTIATNEAVLITTIRGNNFDWLEAHIDGQPFRLGYDESLPFRFALAGPHTLSLSNNGYMSYQRLQASSIKSILPNGQTNVLNIAEGRTAQFFRIMNGINEDVRALIRPEGSTNTYGLFGFNSWGEGNAEEYPHPSISGPATVEIFGSGVVSYYFTDEILQLPPQGFLETPARALEINIEKSYDLINWTATGTFNTSAEAGAFYRLRILK